MPAPGAGSHFLLTEPGPYLFPDLVKYERIDPGPNYLFFLRAFNAGEQRLWVPISFPAARSLLAAPEKEIQLEARTEVRPLITVGMADPVEMPRLARFICFRAISPEWRVCEFTAENGNRLFVSFSTAAYRATIKSLKVIFARKAVPASFFADRKVVLAQNVPVHQRRLTDQEAVEMGAKTLAYQTGIEPGKFLWVWSQLARCPAAEQRKTAKRLWAQLEVDPHKAANPNRSQATIEKFLRRLDPGGKVTFSSMGQCVECLGYFSSKNRKTKYCSAACGTAAAEKCRPPQYHAKFQREKRQIRAEKRARGRMKPAKEKRCGFCGIKHTRKSLFCTPRCKERFAAA